MTDGGWNCENVWNLCLFAGHVGPGVLYSWNFLQLHHERCRLFFGTSLEESKFSRFHLLWMVFPLENPSGQHHVLNRLSWRQVCSMQTSVDWGNQWAPKMRSCNPGHILLNHPFQLCEGPDLSINSGAEFGSFTISTFESFNFRRGTVAWPSWALEQANRGYPSRMNRVSRPTKADCSWTILPN